MGKHYFIFVFIFFSFSVIRSQTVNIPLIFTDGTGSSQTLYFGLDSTATDGIDLHLGESEYPPIPPVDLTIVLFNLQPFIGQYIRTYKDCRYAPTFPYSGIKQHRLIWQLYSESTGLTVTYNLPDSVYIVMTSNNSTPIYSVNLHGSGSFTFPYPDDLFSARMYVHYSESSTIDSSYLLFTPAQLNFGSVTGGQVYNKVLNVKNLGNTNSVTIDSCVVNNINYTVIPPSGFPVILLPGQSVNFNVQITANLFSDTTNILFYHNEPGHISSIPLFYNVNNSNVTQVDVLGKLRVSSSGYQHWLYFGLDSTATDGIDQHLGEGEIPPPCPPTCFDTRMILPVNNFNSIHSYSDYRFANQPFVGQKEYRMYQQPHIDENVVVYWDLPQGVNGFIQDLPFGTDINVAIADTGSFVILQPYDYSRLRLLINYNMESINPVELKTFNAITKNNSVVLDWTTATEINNLGFEVQRLNDSNIEKLKGWVNIGFVNGNGTTTLENQYTFTDNQIVDGKYLYRLKQIDFDGSFNYSNVVDIIVESLPKEFSLSDNYPNPFNPSTKISWQSPVGIWQTIKLFDLLGTEIETIVDGYYEAGSHSKLYIVNSALPSGVYLYRLQAGDYVQTKKMMLLK